MEQERNQEATCYIGDLDTQMTEALLWELCVQVGPVADLEQSKASRGPGRQLIVKTCRWAVLNFV